MGMIVRFDYKCRRCLTVFEDPGTPAFEVSDALQAETILRDSFFRNPTAKKRVGTAETHLCGTGVVGIGDLIGYKISESREALGIK